MLFRVLGDSAGLARYHADLGFVQCQAGDLPAAASHYRKALSLLADLGQRRGVARSLDGFASLALHRGNYAHALTLSAAADSIRCSRGARLRARDQATVDETLDSARKHLDAESAAAAWSIGCRMSVREAIDYALGG